MTLARSQSARTVTLLRLLAAGSPVLTSAIALWAFPIAEQKAYEVRQELEARRVKF